MWDTHRQVWELHNPGPWSHVRVTLCQFWANLSSVPWCFLVKFSLLRDMRNIAPAHLFMQYLLLEISPQTSSPSPRTLPHWAHTYTCEQQFSLEEIPCRNLPAVNSQVMLFIMQQFNHHVAQSHGFSRRSLFTIPEQNSFPMPAALFCCWQGKETKMSPTWLLLWRRTFKLLLTIFVCGKNIW